MRRHTLVYYVAGGGSLRLRLYILRAAETMHVLLLPNSIMLAICGCFQTCAAIRQFGSLLYLLLIEGWVGASCGQQERMDRTDINKDEGLLKEFDGIMKIKEGLTLDDLQSTKDAQKIGKSSSSRKVDEMMIKNKQVVELHKLELQSKKPSQHEQVVTDVPAIMLPSLVYENVKVAFLTRSLVQKLLERPESFEEMVKGAYIRVEVPANVVNKKKSYQLAQVTGITKTSTDGDNTDVKLQALGIPIDISINMLSNAYLTEEECQHLRHEVKLGLRKMLPIEELQRKAISLHEDIIDDCISRELTKLQAKLDQANEKGRRQEFLDLSRKREELESQPEWEQLVNDFLKMITDVQTFSEEILDDKQEKQCAAESIPTKEWCPFKSSSHPSARAERRTPVCRTREIEENKRPSFMQIFQAMVGEAQKGKSVAVESSANLSAEKHPPICMPPPQQGVVSLVHPSPTIMPQSNHQLSSSGGLDTGGLVQFDDITNMLRKDMELPDDQVLGEQYTDEELLNFGYQYDAKMFLIRREIMRRSEKLLKDQKRFNAEHEKLEMNLTEANKKVEIAEDELERLKVDMDEDALSYASKIRMMEEEAELSAEKMRKMEEDAGSSETRTRRMEEDAELTAAKIRKMEGDAELSAAKIKQLEEEAHLSAMKIRKMEEEAELSAAKIRRMEEDARLSGTKMSKMERDARLSSSTIRSLRTMMIGMGENLRKQEEVKHQYARDALSSYKKSKLFVDEVFQLLSPVYSAGWTDSLKEIKENHLLHLDLREFPRFNLNAWNDVDRIYYIVSNSPVPLERLSQASNCVGVPTFNPNASTSGF